MGKKLGRIGCMILALMMVFTTFAALNVSAADDVEVWKTSSTLTGGTTVQILPGIKITPAETFTAKTGAATVDSIQFSNYVIASNNGGVTANGMVGSTFKIETERTGTIAFAAKLGSGKSLLAVNENDLSAYILNVKNTADDAVTAFYSFDIEAGQTYYFWGSGTKPYIYGATFEEKMIVSANAGDTVTVKAEAGSNALLGNVRLGDDTIAITKNSDMTESTFVMPDGDVDLYVDFVSNNVVKEIESLSFDLIKGLNTSEDLVYDDLELFDTIKTSIGDPDVSWTSSNEAVISRSGEVNPATVDTKVEFTGVFSYQDYPNIYLYKTFNLTVPADNDDAGAVADAKAALTLGDTSSVKKNLELPVSGKRNTTITWESSNPDIVSASGAVNPSYTSDFTVILTATISRGSVSDTKEFTVFVPQAVAIEFERAAISNGDGDVVLTQGDGDYLSHIVYTDSINNKTGNEIIVASVYDGNGQLSGEKTFNIKEYSENPDSYNGTETIIYIDKDVLPVNADSVIKISAYEDESRSAQFGSTYTYSATVASNPTVYVAGDSTACTYSATGSNNSFPRTGWAAVLQNYFSGATVKDLAKSGRSSLSFLSESEYTTIKNNIKSGDYFIIQFGHNDSKTGDTVRYTDPNGDRFTDGSYKHSIYVNYIQIALDKGAYPIITTSISRRQTSDASLEAYVNAAKDLGKELGLPVVDLYSKVNGYINDVGAEQAKDIYNYVYAKDSRFINLTEGDFSKSQYYTTGSEDSTHINIYGAKMISQWFCDELERIGHPLIEKRNSFTMSLSDIPSYADAAAASSEAEGDTHKITVNYDTSLGSVNVITGDVVVSGYVINSASYENGTLTVDYDSDGAVSNAKLYVVTYNDSAEDMLANSAIFDLSQSGVDTFAYEKPEGGVTKLFIWNDGVSLTPLSGVYTLN